MAFTVKETRTGTPDHQSYRGTVYANSHTATTDAVRRFETSAKRLRNAWVEVLTNAQSFGDADTQPYAVAVGDGIWLQDVDISTLYFRNTSAGDNGTVVIIGSEE